MYVSCDDLYKVSPSLDKNFLFSTQYKWHHFLNHFFALLLFFLLSDNVWTQRLSPGDGILVLSLTPPPRPQPGLGLLLHLPSFPLSPQVPSSLYQSSWRRYCQLEQDSPQGCKHPVTTSLVSHYYGHSQAHCEDNPESSPDHDQQGHKADEWFYHPYIGMKLIPVVSIIKDCTWLPRASLLSVLISSIVGYLFWLS